MSILSILALVIGPFFSNNVWAVYGGSEVSRADPLAANVMLLFKQETVDAVGSPCAATFIAGGNGQTLITARHCLNKGFSQTLWPVVSFGKLIRDPGRDSIRNAIKFSPSQVDLIPNADLALIHLNIRDANVSAMQIDGVETAVSESEPQNLLPMRFEFLGYGQDLKGLQSYTLNLLDGLEILAAQVPPFQAEPENKNYLFLDQRPQTKGICQGDSGGPLFYRAPSGRLILVALAVLSQGVGAKNYCDHSGIFVKVSPYAQTIQRLIMARKMAAK